MNGMSKEHLVGNSLGLKDELIRNRWSEVKASVTHNVTHILSICVHCTNAQRSQVASKFEEA